MDKFFKWINWAFVVVAVLAVMALFASVAQAATLKGSENCAHLANYYMELAQERDAGFGWADQKAFMEAAIQEATGKPESILQDEDDAKLALELLHDVYHKYAKLSPTETMIQVYLDCRGK